MKKMLILFQLLIVFSAHAQSPVGVDSSIELQLQLIQSGKSGQMAFSVSVENHSKSDIYIPGFLLSNFHLYEYADGRWNELSLFDYHRYPKGGPGVVRGNFLPDVRKWDNEVSAALRKKAAADHRYEDSILKAAFSGNDALFQKASFLAPLFLKAGEHVACGIVFPMDHIYTIAGRYKLSYASEDRDTTVIENSKKILNALPEKIQGFARYLPGPILTNTIYYSSVK